MFKFWTRRTKKKKSKAPWDFHGSLRMDDDDLDSSFARHTFHSTPDLQKLQGSCNSGVLLKSQSSSMLLIARELPSDRDAYNLNNNENDEEDGDADSGRDTVYSSQDFQAEFTDGAENEMPPPREVHRQFEEYLDVLSLMSRQKLEERTWSVEEKWKCIFNQQIRPSIYPMEFYTERLRPLCNTKQRDKKLKEDGSYIATLLRKLKLDLKMSFDSFVEDFIKPPNNGMELLLNVLKFIQRSPATKTPQKGKHDAYIKSVNDEYDCLLCIKFCLRIKGCLATLMESAEGAETISMSLISSFTKTRVLTLEILTVLCALPEGYVKVMDAMTQIRIKYSEQVRFRFLLGMLNSSGAMSVAFQAACVGFFNKLLNSTNGANAKVYLQQELKLAGFEPETLNQFTEGSEPQHSDLRCELEEWCRQYIDVDDLQQRLVKTEMKQKTMKQKVDTLIEEVKAMTKLKDDKIKSQHEENKSLKDKLEVLEKTQDSSKQTIESLETQLKELRSQLGAQKRDEDLKEVINLLDSTISQHEDQTDSSTRPSVVPAPPPMPPPMTPQLPRFSTPRDIEKMKKPSPLTRMPAFDWTPLKRAENTVFETPDTDSDYERIDFKEFENKFKLKTRKESFASKQKRERALKKGRDKLVCIQPPRARNIVITKRRIGQPSRALREAIDKCDVGSLSGECAELLVKFVPMHDETQWLLAHENEANKMGEAEQFLLQLSKVERLEQKLNCMVFMDGFEESVKFIEPMISSVRESSESVLRSERLKRVCKVILAFGNFMNCSKRGFVVGFKLSTLRKLREVKSSDRSQTLLHYLAETLSTKYPDLHHFYEDFEINVSRGATLDLVRQQVSLLESAMKTVDLESKCQSDNITLSEANRNIYDTTTRILQAHEQMEQAFQDVCALFGEIHTQTEVTSFFKTITDFVNDYKNAVAENKARENMAPVVLVDFRHDSTSSAPTSKDTQTTPEKRAKNRPVDNKSRFFLPTPDNSSRHMITIANTAHSVPHFQKSSNDAKVTVRADVESKVSNLDHDPARILINKQKDTSVSPIDLKVAGTSFGGSDDGSDSDEDFVSEL